MHNPDTRDHDGGPHIHPSAVVAHAAKLGRGVSVGPFCIVGPEVELGDGVELPVPCGPGRAHVDRRRNTRFPPLRHSVTNPRILNTAARAPNCGSAATASFEKA